MDGFYIVALFVVLGIFSMRGCTNPATPEAIKAVADTCAAKGMVVKVDGMRGDIECVEVPKEKK